MRVWSAERRRISLTPMNTGLSSTMTQALGEMDTSQSVKAYRASIVLSLDSSAATCIMISTFSAVLSSTLRILILPLSLALMIDSLIDSEVVENGISVMASVRLSIFDMRARTLTAPPLRPSL